MQAAFNAIINELQFRRQTTKIIYDRCGPAAAAGHSYMILEEVHLFVPNDDDGQQLQIYKQVAESADFKDNLIRL